MINLLNTTERLKLYVKVAASMPVPAWRCYLPAALQTIKKVTGEHIIRLANEQYDSSNETIKELVSHIERAAASFIMCSYVKQGSINIGDRGHTVIRTNNEAPASDTKIAAYEKSVRKDGYNSLETLHLFLIREISNISIHQAWTNSQEFASRKNFITTVYCFENNGLVNIESDREVFENLRGTMSFLEKKHIRSKLSSATTDKLIRYATLGNIALTETERYLLSEIQQYIAASTYFEYSGKVNSMLSEQANIALASVNKIIAQNQDFGAYSLPVESTSRSKFFNSIP